MKKLLEHIIAESSEYADAPENGRGTFDVPLSLLEQDPVPMPRYTRFHALTAFAFVVIAGGVVFAGHQGSVFPGGSTLSLSNDRGKSVPVPVLVHNYFETIALSAQSAYVLDVATGKVLYAKNERMVLPLASLTKVMTGLVATDAGDASTRIAIHAAAVQEEGDSGLFPGEELGLKDILDFTLVSSSNDGAQAIAAWAGGTFGDSSSPALPQDRFIAQMNERARALGLSDTTFNNPTGLDLDGSTAGAYGSARDMANLFAHIATHRPEILAATSQDHVTVWSRDALQHTATNTNPLATKIPGLVASKTGYTELAGGNLVVSIDAGVARPVVIAVLGSTEEGRFEDVSRLAQAALETIGRAE